MGWIDIIVIAFITISAIIGLAKGFFDSVLALFGTGLSIFIAIWASKPVTSLVSGIVDIPAAIKKLFINKGWAAIDAGTTNYVVEVDFLGNRKFAIDVVSKFLTTVAIVIVLFVLLKLLIWILSKLFDSATQNSSALSGLNRLFGLFFGMAKGLAFVGIAFAIISIVGNFAFKEQINNPDGMFKNNKVSKFVYTYVDEWVDKTVPKQIEKLFESGKPQPQNNG